ncbi:MAG: hypothetical protein EP338_12325 [Bacteroidetes bacterium]|nr:MAG: hypothetical protein EP338_12325 [Bacteroidota bacterium]
MASKKDFKKYLNNMVNFIVEECYHIQLSDPKKEKASDALIEEAVDFHFDLIQKVQTAKTKKDYAPLREAIEAKEDYFLDAVNKL